MEIINNIKKNTIIIILITILVLYILLRKDFGVIVHSLKTVDIKYLLLAIIFYFLYIFIHSYVVYITVNKKDKFSLKESLKHNIIAQFVNGITPFSTGGQPMEIYMLTEHDIKGSKATNYILQNFVFYQIALVIFGLLAVLANTVFNLFPRVNALRELVFIGFLVNTLVAVILLIITLSKRITNIMIEVCINILYKMHIVKDKDKQIKLWHNKVNEFNECAIELKKRKSLFYIGILLNLIGLGCLYITPLFIVYALGDFKSLDVISTLTSSAYVMVMSAFVPIPGASGGIEYGFTQFFGNFLTRTKTSVALLIWRFITYYIGLILGSILFNIDTKKGDK